MSRFIESIKLKDGVFYRLNFHQQRLNKAFETFYPNEEPIRVYDSLIQLMIPAEGFFKCRMVYDTELIETEIIPYVRREIKSLRVVEMNISTVPYKPEDRTSFNEAFARRNDCDDVLIFRNGLLTDSSYSNVALYDGNDWFTPKTPLIYGVNRAELLQNGKLIEKDISITDLKQYQQIALFNAMIEFGEIVLDIDKVKM